MCGYANRQYTLGEEITENLECSAFRRAMRLAKGTLLILDQTAAPFDRIWCLYELCKTLLDSQMLLDVTAMVIAPQHPDLGHKGRFPIYAEWPSPSPKDFVSLKEQENPSTLRSNVC